MHLWYPHLKENEARAHRWVEMKNLCSKWGADRSGLGGGTSYLEYVRTLVVPWDQLY